MFCKLNIRPFLGSTQSVLFQMAQVATIVKNTILNVDKYKYKLNLNNASAC